MVSVKEGELMKWRLHPRNARDRGVRRRGLWMRNPNNHSQLIPISYPGEKLHQRLLAAGWIEVDNRPRN